MPIQTMSAAQAKKIMAGEAVAPNAMPSPVRTPNPPSLESLFLRIWNERGNGPIPVAEYTFYPGRKWRFDFAFIEQMVAVELDGLVKQAGGGRHSTDADRDKGNFAAAEGWRVLHFSRMQLEDQPEHCAVLVIAALER